MIEKNPSSIQSNQLPNGVRVVTETVTHVESVAIGIWIGSGSSHEPEEQAGAMHFIEHMLFKGTERRTAHALADAIESRGGQINAFTSKEATCYEARLMAEDCELGFDVLGDMLTCSLFAPEEIVNEKQVVLEEIRMVEENPEDCVHDLFEATLYPDHPLGRPIAGSLESVQNLTREGILDTIRALYTPDRVVVAVAGNISSAQVEEYVTRWLHKLEGIAKPVHNTPLVPSCKSGNIVKRDAEQVQFVIGGPAYNRTDARRYALSLLNNVLGGNMSSRLFQEVREKRGLAYSIGTYYRAYEPGGIYCAYGGTNPSTLDETISVIKTEYLKVCESGLTEEELTKAKQQIRGVLALNMESMNARMNRLGESLITHNRVLSLNEIMSAYECVTNEQIIESARYALNPETLTLATVGPPIKSQRKVKTLK